MTASRRSLLESTSEDEGRARNCPVFANAIETGTYKQDFEECLHLKAEPLHTDWQHSRPDIHQTEFDSSLPGIDKVPISKSASKD